MRPNKAATAVHGCHCSVDRAVRMRKVLAIPHPRPQGYPVFLNVMSLFPLTKWIGGSGHEDGHTAELCSNMAAISHGFPRQHSWIYKSEFGGKKISPVGLMIQT